MEEINFWHILRISFFSTREARRKFSSVILKLDGGGLFISNLWKGLRIVVGRILFFKDGI